jgi:hypothetical protein
MKKRYRCTNCQAIGTDANGFEFETEAPTAPKTGVVCPKCSCDSNHPRQRQLITEVVIFHFDPPTNVVGVGRNTIACQPTISITQQGIRATGDYRIVSCDKCKETKEYVDAVARVQDWSSVNLDTLPEMMKLDVPLLHTSTGT